MRFLSLFAGIGGFDRGLELAGHECVGQVEIDPACRSVLAHHFPRVYQWDDIRSLATACTGLADFGSCGVDARTDLQDLLGPSSDAGIEPDWWRTTAYRIDLLVGGFPCQEFSVAGKRAGLGGGAGLFWEIVRIAKAIKPTWGLFENVPGLISSHGGRDFWTVLSGLRECWPVVGYRILDSRYFGVAQRRRRVFLVCGPSERSVREVLFEPEGRGGDSQKGEEAGTRVAAPIGDGAYGTGRATEDDPNLVYGVGTGSGGADDNDGQAGRLIVGETMSHAPCSVKTATGRLDPNGETFISTRAQVRRLTPLEAERLQGFPDGWTDVPGSSDSTRYRQLGNAVTVNLAYWLGLRLKGVSSDV